MIRKKDGEEKRGPDGGQRVLYGPGADASED